MTVALGLTEPGTRTTTLCPRRRGPGSVLLYLSRLERNKAWKNLRRHSLFDGRKFRAASAHRGRLAYMCNPTRIHGTSKTSRALDARGMRRYFERIHGNGRWKWAIGSPTLSKPYATISVIAYALLAFPSAFLPQVNIKEQNTNHSKFPTTHSRSQAANKKERVALRRPISQKTFKEHFFFPREALESNSTLKPTPLKHSQHPHQAPPLKTRGSRLCYRSTKASLLLRIISAF